MQEQTYPRVANAIWLTVLFIVIALAVGIPLVAIFVVLSAFTAIPEAATAVLENIGAAVGTILAFLIVSRRFTRKTSIKPMAFACKHSISPAAVAGFLALTAGSIIMSSEIHNLVTAIVPEPEWYSSIMGQITGQPIIMALITVAVLPAVLEEFLFRGYCTLGLRRNTSRNKTLAASSLLFGLAHLNPWQFFPAAFIGVVLGWLALRSGSILLPIAAHFLNNTGAILVAQNETFLPIRGFNPAYDTPGVFQPLAFTLSGLALLAAGYVVLQRTLPPARALPQPIEPALELG